MATLPATLNQIAPINGAGAEGFNLHDLHIFTEIPDNRDFGIAVLRGAVIVYDEKPLHCEGVIEGAYYVRESQRPKSCASWEWWLEWEWKDRGRRVGPASPLRISREVVQAIRWPYENDWSLRLPSGFVDGPYHDWAFGTDLIGKVAGLYVPQVRQ